MADTLINAIRDAECEAKRIREDAKRQAAALIAEEKQKTYHEAHAIEQKARDEAEAILQNANRKAAETGAAAGKNAAEEAAANRVAADRKLDEAAALILKERIGT